VLTFTLLTFALGVILGWLFYAGLYRTVSQLSRTRRPGLLSGAGMLLRISVLLSGFWLVLRVGPDWLGERWPDTGWLPLVPALLGLLAIRGILFRVYGRPGAGPPARRHTSRDGAPR
jgi:F1F0 ATPase subunit 2